METSGPGARTVEVAVVGAGIAGLAAAWALRGRDVAVLEADTRVGGRIRSERRGDYWLNLGAHVFGGPETATGRLLAETGVEAVPVPGRLAALAYRGVLLAGGRVETYPFRLPLSARERLALVRAGLRVRAGVARYDRVLRPRPGESEDERQARALSFLNDRSFRDLVGDLPEGADALLRPTVTRSSAEPEELAAGHGVGYFHLVWRPGEGLSRVVPGGSSTLPEAIAEALGDRLVTGARVTAVEPDDGGVSVRYAAGGAEHVLRASHAVVATPAYATAEIVAGLPAETASALRAVPYGPYVSVALLTGETRPMPWDGVYALATPGRAFNMVFDMANVLRGGGERRPGGSLMLYSGGRRLAAPLLERSDDEIVAAYLADLADLFPGADAIVEEAVVRRLPRALPYPAPGRRALQPALTRPLGRIHLAGDYLGTFYTDTAIRTGRTAAERILGALA